LAKLGRERPDLLRRVLGAPRREFLLRCSNVAVDVKEHPVRELRTATEAGALAALDDRILEHEARAAAQ
jgi:hypothetical protein